MTYLSPALQRAVNERTKTDQMRSIHEDVSVEEMQVIEARIHAQLDLAKQAATIAEELGKLAMGGGSRDYLVTALATEHRTILGQVMAAISRAILATAEDPEVSGPCPLGGSLLSAHPRHDGRLTCRTVVAATLGYNQPLI